MTYAIQRDAFVRTRQDLLVIGARECQNSYAALVQQLLTRTEEMDHSDWTKTSVTVAADNAEAPDGTMTADTVTFNATSDALTQTPASPATVVTSKSFTGSVYLRVPSGAQQVQIIIRNAGTTELSNTSCSVTTTWTRFWVQFLFSATPVDNVVFEIIRTAFDDVTDLEVWGAQLYQNPSDVNRVVMFPYTKRVSEAASTLSVNVSRCNISDNGDGSRCYYSRPTCQDPDDFNAGHEWENSDETDLLVTGVVFHRTPTLRGIREFRFCRKDTAIPIPSELVMPSLVELSFAAQEILPDKAITANARITFGFEDDQDPGVWNVRQQQDGGLVNTTTTGGTFWKRFAYIYKNYANPEGYAIRKIGYVEPGLSESGMVQRGKYLIRNIETNTKVVRLVCTDRLKLTRKQIPPKIDVANKALGPLNNSQTTFNVTDSTEIPIPGDGYTVTLELSYDEPDPDPAIASLEELFGIYIPNKTGAEKVNVTGISGNTVTVQRGRWGTSAKAHTKTLISFRVVYEFGTERSTPSLDPIGKNPMDCIIEAYRFAGLASAEIDTTTLEAERDRWISTSADATTGDEYGPLVRRTLVQQTEVESIIRELRDLNMILLWINEDGLLTGRIFAPPIPGASATALTDESNLVADTISVDDNDEARLTGVLLAYNVPAAIENPSSAEDFLEVNVAIDIDSEEREYYGDQRRRSLFTQWLRPGDTATASFYTIHMLERFKHGARIVSWESEVRDDDILLGDDVTVETDSIQDAHGNRRTNKLIITKKRPLSENRILFEGIDTGLYARVGFWSGSISDYSSASSAEKEYGYWSNTLGQVGSPLEPGYVWW